LAREPIRKRRAYFQAFETITMSKSKRPVPGRFCRAEPAESSKFDRPIDGAAIL
jgi:hypothetical protein